MFKEMYSHQIPSIFRMLGITRVCKNSLEFNWGYISFGHGPELKLDHTYEYGIPRLCVWILWITFHVELPFIKQRFEDVNHSPEYGFSYHNKSVWWQWGMESKSFRMPWDWAHVCHEVWAPSGWLEIVGYSFDSDGGRVIETHPYSYTLKSGELQSVTATIYKERRTWKWHAFQWLPYPKMVRTSISIDFSSEVGEDTGSWKGGTVGCGYDINPGETMLQCLRRMEQEREFK